MGHKTKRIKLKLFLVVGCGIPCTVKTQTENKHFIQSVSLVQVIRKE